VGSPTNSEYNAALTHPGAEATGDVGSVRFRVEASIDLSGVQQLADTIIKSGDDIYNAFLSVKELRTKQKRIPKLDTLVRRIERDVQKTVRLAVEEACEMLLEESMQMTPLDEGDLRASGRIQGLKVRRDNVKAYVVYGDSKANYAYFVHENMPSKPPVKNYTTPGTGHHYLSIPGYKLITPALFQMLVKKHSSGKMKVNADLET